MAGGDEGHDQGSNVDAKHELAHGEVALNPEILQVVLTLGPTLQHCYLEL